MGTPMPNNSFNFNRLIWEQAVEFREQWSMEVVPLPLALRPQALQQPQQQQPPAAPISAYALMRMNLGPGEFMKHLAFLSEIRKPGLLMLYNKIRIFNDPNAVAILNADRFSNVELANLITRVFPDGDDDPRKPIFKLLGQTEFLRHAKHSGLDIILRNLGITSNGTVDVKLASILRNTPLDITFRDEHGEFQLVLTRGTSLQEIQSEVLWRRSPLRLTPSALTDGCVVPSARLDFTN